MGLYWVWHKRVVRGILAALALRAHQAIYNSLERTQPRRGFMYDIAVLRRSARNRYAYLFPSDTLAWEFFQKKVDRRKEHLSPPFDSTTRLQEVIGMEGSREAPDLPGDKGNGFI